MQKFYSSKTDTFTSPNGAVGYRSGGPMDCLGPYAKVQNCPIDGTDLRLTAYATGYADTAFSIPACTRYRGQYVGGYFTSDEKGTKFMPYDRFKSRLTVPVDIKIRQAVKTIFGAKNARVTKNGELHVFGKMPNTNEQGWYLLGFTPSSLSTGVGEKIFNPDGSLNFGLANPD